MKSEMIENGALPAAVQECDATAAAKNYCCWLPNKLSNFEQRYDSTAATPYCPF